MVATTTTSSRVSEIAGLGVVPAVLSLDDADKLHDTLADRDCVCFCVAAGRSRQSYLELYANGARRLVDACSGTAVRRILYTSSTRVYAQDDGSMVDEDSPTEPPDEDGQALVQAERTLLDARNGGLHSDTSVSVLRLGGIHGPGRELAARIHLAAGAMRTDGDAYVNLIHLNDIVEAMIRLMGMNHHGVINVCDGRPTLRRELYDREIASAGLAAIRWSSSGGQPRGKRVSTDRLRQLLGMTPQPAD